MWTALDMDGNTVSVPNTEIEPAVVEWASDTLEMAIEFWLSECA